jgi:hypothetical protein
MYAHPFGLSLSKPVQVCRGCGSSGKPGLAPAGDSLSLASPRESKQREGDPMVWVPPLRYGQPAVLAENGVELELAFGSDNRSP